MKPEILKYGSTVKIESNKFKYDEKLQLNVINGNPVVNQNKFIDGTTKSATGESSDPDEIIYRLAVQIDSIETVGTNKFLGTSSQMSETRENSDPDEILCFSTQKTKTIENSDPDEILYR